MSILMVGSVALDTVETPCGKVEDGLGGSAVHASLAASHLAPVEVVGVVGSDFPKRHIKLLEKAGIGTQGLEIVKGGCTFRWGGRYFTDINQRETLFTELGCFETFRPKVPPTLARLPYVFLANIDPVLQLQVLDQCKKPKLVMLDTMNLWIDIRREALIETLRRVDVVLLNDEEARQLADVISLEKAAKIILNYGVKRVIIKKGEHGAIMFSSKGFFAAPGLPLGRVVDPTGAGDTFAGGLIGYLARTGATDEKAMRQAMLVGTALASCCVEDFSVRRVSKLKKEDFRKRLKMATSAIACPAFRV